MAKQTSERGGDAVKVDDPSETAGAKTAQINADPTVSLEETRNAAAGEDDNAAGSTAPSTAEEAVPSTSDPEASDIPSADNH